MGVAHQQLTRGPASLLGGVRVGGVQVGSVQVGGVQVGGVRAKEVAQPVRPLAFGLALGRG
jgi:hypothetical protein